MNEQFNDNLNHTYEAFHEDHDVLRQKLMDALPEHTTESKRGHPGTRGHRLLRGPIMNGKITKLAAAAGILLAALLGIHFLGGSPTGTTVAWADVLAQMEAAQTVTFAIERDATSDEDGHWWSKGTARIKEPFHRLDESGGHRYGDGPVHEESNICIMDLSRNRRFIHLVPEAKWAYYAPDHGSHDTLLTYDGLKRDFRDGTEKYLGWEVVDGRNVICFKVTKDGNTITVWANSETALPVRIKRVAHGGAETTTLSHITFDVELDDSLFDMTVPDDYVVVNLQTEEFTVPFELTEDYLIGGLREAAVSLGGTFPLFFFMGGRPGALQEHLAELKKAAPTKTFGIANLAAEYMKRLPNGSHCQYLGECVELGNADSVVFWYQRPDSPTCRVIYGDLAVRDVAPEDLPEAPWPPAELNFRP